MASAKKKMTELWYIVGCCSITSVAEQAVLNVAARLAFTNLVIAGEVVDQIANGLGSPWLSRRFDEEGVVDRLLGAMTQRGGM